MNETVFAWDRTRGILHIYDDAVRQLLRGKESKFSEKQESLDDPRVLLYTIVLQSLNEMNAVGEIREKEEFAILFVFYIALYVLGGNSRSEVAHHPQHDEELVLYGKLKQRASRLFTPTAATA